jgi:arylsulfatase A-like enzyme
VLFGTLALAACSGQKRPSIVLVTIDTARADAFGAFGGSAATPAFDSLAKDGVLFTSALTPAPITHPAHTSLFTGLYPGHHGVRDNGLFKLDDSAVTMAECLADQGYDTAAFVSAVVLTRACGLAQGFAHYDDAGLSGGHLERLAHDTIAAAVQHLQRAAKDHPFFYWVHLYDPHFPYEPPEPFASQFKEQPYLGEVSYADSELQHLIDAARAIDPQTLFVVASDHGEGLGEHGEATHGIFLYQSTVHIPLVMAGATLPRGRRVDDLVSLIDVFPTLCEIAGVHPPPGLDGRILRSEIDGADAADTEVSLETMLPYLSYGWSALHAVVHDHLKVVAAPRPEMFDLVTDPREERNLASERAAELGRWLTVIKSRRGAMQALNAKPYRASQQELQSLGYVSTPRQMDGRETAGPDPKDMVYVLELEAQAQWLMQRSEWDKARGILDSVLASNPEHTIAREMLGTCWLKLGEYGRARALFEAVLKQRPDRVITTFYLGLCNEMTGQIDKGRELYEMTIKIDDRYAPAHLRLANILWQQREKEAARTHYERYLALAPNEPQREAAVRERLRSGQ